MGSAVFFPPSSDCLCWKALKNIGHQKIHCFNHAISPLLQTVLCYMWQTYGTFSILGYFSDGLDVCQGFSQQRPWPCIVSSRPYICFSFVCGEMDRCSAHPRPEPLLIEPTASSPKRQLIRFHTAGWILRRPSYKVQHFAASFSSYASLPFTVCHQSVDGHFISEHWPS